jgi:L-fuculose-phosphate aldolase
MASDLWLAERTAVLETAQELARQGLVSGASGNVSLLIPGETPLLAITPSRRAYRSMTAADIPVIDFEGDPLYGEFAPSSETMLHVAVYNARRDVRSVVHTHSVYASVCAVSNITIPPVIDEVVVLVGGEVRVAPYQPPGSEELAQSACEALEGRSAALLSNHGLVAVGHDLEAAMDVAVLVERAAQICVMTKLLGTERLLPPEVISVEEGLYQMHRTMEENA